MTPVSCFADLNHFLSKLPNQNRAQLVWAKRCPQPLQVVWAQEFLFFGLQ